MGGTTRKENDDIQPAGKASESLVRAMKYLLRRMQIRTEPPVLYQVPGTWYHRWDSKQGK